MPKTAPTEGEIRAKLKQKRAAERAQAMKNYHSAEIASSINMFRLRELRLATKPSEPGSP